MLSPLDKQLPYSNGHKPFHGFGLGLRPEYYQEILDQRPNLDWLEIISENYLVDGGKPLYFLDQFKERYPIAMHGVGMNIASTDSLNLDYLSELKKLVNHVKPLWVSDHCCWTGVNSHNTHDLLPLPFNEESIKHIVSRIQQIQDYLEQPILIENLSSYLSFKASDMHEWEFLTAICEEADCYLLLDINNIYVNSRNHNFEPLSYIQGVPKKRVIQHHLAGHSDHGDYIIDTHDAPVVPSVLTLYKQALEHFGPVSVMIERDDNFPALKELLSELDAIREIFSDVQNEQTS